MDVLLWKRVFDLIVSGVGAIVWLPVAAICALAVWVFDGRPIFYWSQRRVFRDQSARIAKFRTMVRDAARIVNRKTVPILGQRFLNIPLESPLHTPVGRVIERFHFTEIPQFAHVLSGKMSVVGNRPLPEDVIDALRDEFPDVEARFAVRCGMTGPVQLIGRDSIPDADRLALESEYCHASMIHYSMRLDLIILALTILIGTRLARPRSIDEVRALIRKFTRTTALDPVERLLPGRTVDGGDGKRRSETS